MTTPNRPPLRRRILRACLQLALVPALVLAAGLGTASAQYAASLPFSPYSDPYESFAYPIVPSNFALPNQGRFTAGLDPFVSGRPDRFSRPFSFDLGFDSSLVDLPATGAGLDAGRRLGATTGGRYVPYSSVYRLYDREFNRTYQPNREVDAPYYEQRERRERLYLQALSTQDPQERSRLLKELDQANREARRDFGFVSQRRTGSGTAAGTTPLPTSGARRRSTGALGESGNPALDAGRAGRRVPSAGAIPPAPDLDALGGLTPSEILERGRAGVGAGTLPAPGPVQTQPSPESEPEADLPRPPAAPSRRRR